MTKPSGALASVAFSELVERISKDQEDKPLTHPSCAHWRLIKGGSLPGAGMFYLWAYDLSSRSLSVHRQGHGMLLLFEWVVGVLEPVTIVLSLLHRGGCLRYMYV